MNTKILHELVIHIEAGILEDLFDYVGFEYTPNELQEVYFKIYNDLVDAERRLNELCDEIDDFERWHKRYENNDN